MSFPSGQSWYWPGGVWGTAGAVQINQFNVTSRRDDPPGCVTVTRSRDTATAQSSRNNSQTCRPETGAPLSPIVTGLA